MLHKHWILVGLVGLLVDQITKYVSIKYQFHQLNTGVAFGLFDQQVSSLAVIGLGFIALLVITFSEWQSHPASLSLIWAGGVSNSFDRLRWGGVIDFLPVPFFDLRNNFADWLITIGIIVFLWNQVQVMLRNKHK